jgi:hypothetical protein
MNENELQRCREEEDARDRGEGREGDGVGEEKRKEKAAQKKLRELVVSRACVQLCMFIRMSAYVSIENYYDFIVNSK